MSSIFDRFGGGQSERPAGPDAPPQAAPQPAADSGAQPVRPAADEQGGAPVLTPASDGKPDEQPAPEIVPGVPLWLHGTDGDAIGIYWLVQLDLDATHEYGQPSRHAGIDGDRQVAGIGAPVQKSGGAAYYFNVVSGKGFSVPVDPQGA